MNNMQVNQLRDFIDMQKQAIHETHHDSNQYITLEITGNMVIKKITIKPDTPNEYMENNLPQLINEAILSVSMRLKDQLERFQNKH